MGVVVHQEPVAGHLGCPPRHRHRLGGRRRFIEQGRVRQGEAGELCDHGLKVEQRFQPTLADLGLIGGVRGVPGRVLKHVALNDRRRDCAVVALPDQAGALNVAVSKAAQFAQHILHGSAAGQRQVALHTDGGRNGLREQRLDRVDAEDRQHVRLFLRSGADVPADEVVGAEQCRQEPTSVGERGLSRSGGHRKPPGHSWRVRTASPAVMDA